MTEAERTSVQLDNLRPTWIPFAFVCLTVLLWTCAFMGARLFPNQPFGAGFPYVAATGLTFFWAVRMGGLKLWTDWRDRNWYGYYRRLWQIKPNHLDGDFVNHKHLPNLKTHGWVLHVSLGGWFGRHFFAYNGKRLKQLRVVAVKWNNFTGTLEAVTVADNAGNRLTQHSWWCLHRLNLCWSTGELGLWINPLAALLNDEERQQSAELQKVRIERDRLSELVGGVDEKLGGIVESIEQGNRLKSTKEGRRLHGALVAVRHYLATSMFRTQSIVDGSRSDAA